jgi:hypothetical protein
MITLNKIHSVQHRQTLKMLVFMNKSRVSYDYLENRNYRKQCMCSYYTYTLVRSWFEKQKLNISQNE